MAKVAERLLEGTGWLPEPLRLADAASTAAAAAEVENEAEALPAFLIDENETEANAAEPQTHAVAAD
jgi:ParB family chromosome partitioning protein